MSLPPYRRISTGRTFSESWDALRYSCAVIMTQPTLLERVWRWVFCKR